MKYFIDTEFIEGFHKPLFGKKRHFIDLISIGIVGEDSREYYSVSNEFDLNKAWGNEWVRWNVLKPLHEELCSKESVYSKTYHWELYSEFNKKSMRLLLKWHGKSNLQIEREVINFCNPDSFLHNTAEPDLEFYGYYSDYDWVVLCSLFGKMLDLPKFFPMYCRDLKQMLDERLEKHSNSDFFTKFHVEKEMTLAEKLVEIKKHRQYPQQENEHNALADAKWNYELYKFLNP